MGFIYKPAEGSTQATWSISPEKNHSLFWSRLKAFAAEGCKGGWNEQGRCSSKLFTLRAELDKLTHDSGPWRIKCISTRERGCHVLSIASTGSRCGWGKERSSWEGKKRRKFIPSSLSSGSKAEALKSRLLLPQCVLLLPINKPRSWWTKMQSSSNKQSLELSGTFRGHLVHPCAERWEQLLPRGVCLVCSYRLPWDPPNLRPIISVLVHPCWKT